MALISSGFHHFYAESVPFMGFPNAIFLSANDSAFSSSFEPLKTSHLSAAPLTSAQASAFTSLFHLKSCRPACSLSHCSCSAHKLTQWTGDKIKTPCNGTISELEGVTCNNERVFKLSFAGFSLFISNCTNLQSLDLSANRLTGEIPMELQYLVNLAVLNLSANELAGPIPPSLILCAYLNVIDLHDNRLTDTADPVLPRIDNGSVSRKVNVSSWHSMMVFARLWIGRGLRCCSKTVMKSG